jgi:hypothetical protein
MGSPIRLEQAARRFANAVEIIHDPLRQATAVLQDSDGKREAGLDSRLLDQWDGGFHRLRFAASRS